MSKNHWFTSTPHLGCQFVIIINHWVGHTCRESSYPLFYIKITVSILNKICYHQKEMITICYLSNTLLESKIANNVIMWSHSYTRVWAERATVGIIYFKLMEGHRVENAGLPTAVNTNFETSRNIYALMKRLKQVSIKNYKFSVF